MSSIKVDTNAYLCEIFMTKVWTNSNYSHKIAEINGMFSEV